jgi:hypothetical protein
MDHINLTIHCHRHLSVQEQVIFSGVQVQRSKLTHLWAALLQRVEWQPSTAFELRQEAGSSMAAGVGRGRSLLHGLALAAPSELG